MRAALVTCAVAAILGDRMLRAANQTSRVLVVDDDEAKRYTIVHPLRGIGIQVEEAASAGQALELARGDPDLIILDVKLPDMSGFEVCDRLKADPVTAPIPVLYVSAHFRTSEDRVRGLKGGADGYLVTPVTRDELLATVAVWLRVRKAERERRRLVTALDRERAFLESVIQQLPLGVLIAEAPSGRMLFANAVAREVFGEAVDAVEGISEYERFPLTHLDGQRLTAEEYPLARALRGERVNNLEVRVGSPPGPVLTTSAAPVLAHSGEIVGAVVVVEDVSERKHDEEQLRMVGQLREELIGILGHDLRNPIQAIKMSLRSLESAQLPFRQQNAVTRIHNSTERMRRMIDDMVDFASSRLGGRIQIRTEEVDLVEVVGDVVEELRSAHPKRTVSLDTDAAVTGRWDPDRLAQLASNLIGNALQHSPADTAVTVSVHREDHTALLLVHNLGKPIPAQELGALFQPFRRAENAEDKRGVGLGLYISSQVVLAHGGRISVTSTAEEGTRFRVELPLGSG